MINITASGNVGKDAEVKNLNGFNCLIFSLASTKKVKGENVTQWVNCKIWGERAEKLKPYILKGTSLVVNGEGSVNAYTKQDGSVEGTININVTDFQFMGKAEAKKEVTIVSKDYTFTPDNVTMSPSDELDLPF